MKADGADIGTAILLGLKYQPEVPPLAGQRELCK
jgi:hypothetical protein